MSQIEHWGEIKSADTTIDVSEDIEKAMDHFCLEEFHEEELVVNNEVIELPPMNPLVLYAISLHKYANDMEEMIRLAEVATDVNVIAPEDAVPPMPVMPEELITHQTNSLNFLPKDFTDFSTGKDVEMPELSDVVVKQILSKCIATMFCHIGYETTHQSMLDILVDVLQEFYKIFLRRLRIAVEDIENGHPTFPNAIEKVLHETGFGGAVGLHNFYQRRILKYAHILQKRCEHLNELYSILLIPKATSPTFQLNTTVRVKQEAEDDMDVEELHFTSITGEVCASLESGYQLLNSLENETSLPTFGDQEEDL